MCQVCDALRDIFTINFILIEWIFEGSRWFLSHIIDFQISDINYFISSPTYKYISKWDPVWILQPKIQHRFQTIIIQSIKQRPTNKQMSWILRHHKWKISRNQNRKHLNKTQKGRITNLKKRNKTILSQSRRNKSNLRIG